MNIAYSHNLKVYPYRSMLLKALNDSVIIKTYLNNLKEMHF